ncbi:DEDD exonuclease domain-containing protein [Mycobacterium avium]|uniref:DEDD exonuclease domain-containing protein n=1 Tax=Mycobacterium avium TaxID=1764 RepID=UPI0039B744E2
MASDGATQLSFADVGPAFGPDEVALRDTTFVVVDLETTGGRSTSTEETAPDAITEIGAVKVRGGVVLGEFATLVDPQRSIPPQIMRLTGITTAMVSDAPAIDAVLPMFLEFAGLDRGAVLVAHNAGFDVGFLRAAAQQCDIAWPRPRVLCTVRLARRVLSREEAPSVRLASLARLFAVTTQPTHRALDDARATVDVLHALIERVGNQGVHTYADLRGYLPDVTPTQRRKRVLAEGLPRRPGVYLFRGPSGEVLYIGTAVDLRRRVAQYFTGADPRGRMKEMVALAGAVDHVECAHALEAGVRELRLLAAHAPPYNRRSRFPQRWWWVALTDEAYPRLAVVRAPRHDRAVGPLGPRRRRRHRRAAGPVRRAAHLHQPAGPGSVARAAVPGGGGGAVPGRPRRHGHPIRGRGGEGRGVDRRRRQQRAGRRGGPGRCAGRAASLRKRRPAARPHRHRGRDAVARPAAAGPGLVAGAGCRRARRAGRLSAGRRPLRPARRGGQRPARGATDAGG